MYLNFNSTVLDRKLSGQTKLVTNRTEIFQNYIMQLFFIRKIYRELYIIIMRKQVFQLNYNNNYFLSNKIHHYGLNKNMWHLKDSVLNCLAHMWHSFKMLVSRVYNYQLKDYFSPRNNSMTIFGSVRVTRIAWPFVVLL